MVKTRSLTKTDRDTLLDLLETDENLDVLTGDTSDVLDAIQALPGFTVSVIEPDEEPVTGLLADLQAAERRKADAENTILLLKRMIRERDEDRERAILEAYKEHHEDGMATSLFLVALRKRGYDVVKL